MGGNNYGLFDKASVGQVELGLYVETCHYIAGKVGLHENKKLRLGIQKTATVDHCLTRISGGRDGPVLVGVCVSEPLGYVDRLGHSAGSSNR
jgi:hypothetical protein